MNTNIVIKIGEANTTIEGNPIELKGIELSYQIDANAQEMATSGGILNNVYDKIQEMAKSFNTPTPTPTPTITPAKSDTSFCEIQNEANTEKAGQRWDLPAVWSCMMTKRPEGFKKTGVGHYTFECGSMKEKNRIRVVIEFKQDSIDCDITVQDSTAFCHLYEDAEYSSISGINAALIGELIEALPDDIKDFVSDYIKKIQTK